jgi:predicted phosphoadenosine phosphosulfate sulfurtransferase
MNTKQKVNKYISDWKLKGYCEDIPDEVPDVLMQMNLAPSYKAIALAILKNDMQMESLGFSAKPSEWYSYYKKIEIESRSNV